MAEEIEHGTHSGWMKHYRQGTAPCEPCVEAHRAYGREATRRYRKEHGMGRNRWLGRTRQLAVNRLISAHAKEFRQLLADVRAADPYQEP